MIGTRPAPPLPVDSATSCSAQSPNPAILSAARSVELVAPGTRRGGEDRAQPEPGILGGAHLRAAGDQHALGASEELLDVVAHERCGTSPTNVSAA